jgi:hypothetical protein
MSVKGIRDHYSNLPSDVRIDRWRYECWSLLTRYTDAAGIRYGFRDLVRINTNDEVRAAIREGADPTPMDAETYLYDLLRQGCPVPLVHGWARDGLVVAEPRSNGRLIPVSELGDAEVFEFLDQGWELLIYDRAVRRGTSDPHGRDESIPKSIHASWMRGKDDLLTRWARERGAERGR